MYKTILVTLDATPTDRAIIDHVKKLANVMGSSVVLFHVATGVPAQFHGPNAAGQEVAIDRAAEKIRQPFREGEGSEYFRPRRFGGVLRNGPAGQHTRYAAGRAVRRCSRGRRGQCRHRLVWDFRLGEGDHHRRLLFRCAFLRLVSGKKRVGGRSLAAQALATDAAMEATG